MKLNKMLALALSGVMAVSMLAGCSGAPSNGEEGDKEQTVVTAGTATMMNNFQNRVKFDADADLDAYVAAAVKTVKSDVLDDAPAGVTPITGGKIYDAVDKALPGSYSLTKGETDFDEACIKKADTTKTVLYWVKAGNLTEAQVLTLVADDMNMAAYDEVCANDDMKNYTITYTGAASIVKATATSEAGDTYNAYVVAVSVTQSVGDQVNDKT